MTIRTAFLSSTARDLEAYRKAVYDAIQRMDGFKCVGMEDFGARDARTDEFCRERIAECDLAVFLIGLCFGSTPEGTDESYTAQEHRAALDKDVPRLAFLSGDNEFYPGYFRESDASWQKQQVFREMVGKDRLPDNFGNPEELAAKVVIAIGNWADKNKAASRAPQGTTYYAKVDGSGAAAQGKGAVAAGAGGVAIKGDVHGDVHVSTKQSITVDDSELRSAYLNRVMERCGYVSLAGVDPAIAGKQEADTRLNLNAVYTALLTRSPRESERTLQRDHEPWSAEEERLQSALESLDEHRLLVLQGDPGSGKSTFANFVALCLAGEALGDPQAKIETLTAPLPDDEGEDRDERQPWSHGELLPVPVTLRDFAATGLPERGKTATAQQLWDFIEKDLKAGTLSDYASNLKNTLLHHGGLMLLDGLDEVPEAEARREQVKQAVEDFVGVYRHCRVLVTSRTYAYQNQDWRLAGFDEAVLAPFSDGQIRRFVTRWYAHTVSLERMSDEDAVGRAQLLKNAIFAQPRLRELAERPLLLTLMASLHAWRGGNLPEKRERLYADTVELLLDFWESRRVKRDTKGQPILPQPSLVEWLKADRDQVRGVLEALAFEAHRAQSELVGTADISEDSLMGRLMRLSRNPDVNPVGLVEYLRERAGLLMPRGLGVYTFPHRSFQEYLAACCLTGDSYPDEVAELARKDPDRWREVALLAGAKAARGTASTIWQLADTLCYRSPSDPDVDRDDEWGAQLAAQALVESADLTHVRASNQLKLERVRDWLMRLIRSEHLPATERVQAGDNLARLGDPRFDPELWYLPDDPLLGFIEIPAGEFKMGSDKQRDNLAGNEEVPQHKVSLSTFYLARWPVTADQFKVFVEASEYEPADRESLEGMGNRPVVTVTWHDALAYCRWLDERVKERAKQRLSTGDSTDASTREFWQSLADGSLGVGLPSEAEWESAARGVDGRIYPWGDEFDANRTNSDETGLGDTSAVGCFPGGASLCGCEEMSGNVWEWTRSLWGKNWQKPEFAYPYNSTDGRENLNAPDDVPRVLRGGSFHYDRVDVRCASRYGGEPVFGSVYVGFRVVVSPFVSER